MHTNRILSTITRTAITTYSDVGLSQEQSSLDVFDSVVIIGVDDVEEVVGRSSETAKNNNLVIIIIMKMCFLFILLNGCLSSSLLLY